MSGRRAAPLRVLHLPYNVSNQAGIIVKGLRELGHTADLLEFDANRFGYDVSGTNLRLGSIRTRWGRLLRRIAHFLLVMPRYDVFHYHYGGWLLPKGLDFPILAAFRKRVVMEFHGSEIRKPSIAARKNPYYRNVDGTTDRQSIDLQSRISRHVTTALVGDDELRTYVESSFRSIVVLPRRIDISRYAPHYPDATRQRPMVIHAPSSRNVKGTEQILATIERLRGDLAFDFTLVENRPHAEMIEIIKSSDIVIDQMMIGAYGVFAIEALALGKPVVCYLREDLIDRFPAPLPIIRANPDTLTETLARLIGDPVARYEIGIRSRQYAESVHDYRRVTLQVLGIYRALGGSSDVAGSGGKTGRGEP